MIVACAQSPEHLATLVSEGKALATSKRFRAALVPLDRAIDTDARNAEARRWRGHCLTAVGSCAKALANLDVAVAVDDSNAWAWYARGMAKHHLGRHPEAIADYTEALRRDPNDHKAIEWRGFNRSQIGDHRGAYDDFTDAAKLDSKNSWVFTSRARAAANLLKFDQAKADLEAALRLHEADAGAHAQLGFLLVAMGDDSGALVSFDRATKLQSEGFEYVRLWQYWLRTRLGKPTKDADRRLPASGWAGDLAKVLLGELTREQLLSRPVETGLAQAELTPRRCEAMFYLGIRALITGDANRGSRFFREALEAGDATMPEWRVARRLARD